MRAYYDTSAANTVVPIRREQIARVSILYRTSQLGNVIRVTTSGKKCTADIVGNIVIKENKVYLVSRRVSSFRNAFGKKHTGVHDN